MAMSRTRLASPPSPRFVLVFLLASAIPWRPVLAQATSPPPTPPQSHSLRCSPHSYQVSVNGTPPAHSSNGCVDRETCLSTTPALNGSEDSCVSLREILGLHKTQDCLELIFAPGTYRLSSLLTRVRIQFSLVMSAPEGGVTFACEESMCDGGIGGSDGGAGTTMAMMAFEHTDLEEEGGTFVRIEGIDFRNCSGKLQFDEVGNVSITNCTFV